ncbi:MAG: Fur family transcriptional regulator [Actinomycetes bacterium]
MTEPTTDSWDALLRQRGYRITPQRQLVLAAVNELQHGTPEEILTVVQRTAAAVNLSTVYRTLEVLQEVGVITHAHIGHGAPVFHALEEATHIHLVCEECGKVTSIDAAVARPFIEAMRDLVGFETDVGHVSIHGRCSDCQTAATHE